MATDGKEVRKKIVVLAFVRICLAFVSLFVLLSFVGCGSLLFHKLVVTLAAGIQHPLGARIQSTGTV